MAYTGNRRNHHVPSFISHRLFSGNCVLRSIPSMKGEREMTLQRELLETEKKSKGHLGIFAKWEYFRTPNGEIYRADITNVMGLDGYRTGARFEASKIFGFCHKCGAVSNNHHCN